MRWPYLVPGACIAATIVGLAADSTFAQPNGLPELTAQERYELEAAVAARVFANSPAPEADALAAAQRGEFGLITTGSARAWPRLASPLGLTCYTPEGEAPQTLFVYLYGDATDERDEAWWAYASACNRTLADHPDYPDADLCRGSVDGDHLLGWPTANLAARAQQVTGPSGGLHEAARRSGAAEVHLWLASTPVDALDVHGMTPLAWATARGNLAAVGVLLAAGGNPWLSERSEELGAVYLAAALGRAELFDALAARPDRPFISWPSTYLAAALMGGSRPIIELMLAEEHERLDVPALLTPLPSARALELTLRDDPSLAEPLLLQAVKVYSVFGWIGPDPRLDLVILALAHGASPNAPLPIFGRPTALGLATTMPGPATVAIVETLLQAGADPNLLSDFQRPVVFAVERVGARFGEFSRYAEEIFHLLLDAGADINLVDGARRPGIWALLFPTAYKPFDLFARDVTTEALELLVSNGLDINAEFRGLRVLPLVEAQAGTNSELAVTLRRLGAV